MECRRKVVREARKVIEKFTFHAQLSRFSGKGAFLRSHLEKNDAIRKIMKSMETRQLPDSIRSIAFYCAASFAFQRELFVAHPARKNRVAHTVGLEELSTSRHFQPRRHFEAETRRHLQSDYSTYGDCGSSIKCKLLQVLGTRAI